MNSTIRRLGAALLVIGCVFALHDYTTNSTDEPLPQEVAQQDVVQTQPKKVETGASMSLDTAEVIAYLEVNSDKYQDLTKKGNAELETIVNSGEMPKAGAAAQIIGNRLLDDGDIEAGIERILESAALYGRPDPLFHAHQYRGIGRVTLTKGGSGPYFRGMEPEEKERWKTAQLQAYRVHVIGAMLGHEEFSARLKDTKLELENKFQLDDLDFARIHAVVNDEVAKMDIIHQKQHAKPLPLQPLPEGMGDMS